jgi:threonine synthase
MHGCLTYYTAKMEHAAAGNASKLERRSDIAMRIAYLRRQGDEEILHAKRERIEQLLWDIHTANVAHLWETVEVDRLGKQGKPVLGEDGEPLKKKVQRPKMLSEFPTKCSARSRR